MIVRIVSASVSQFRDGDVLLQLVTDPPMEHQDCALVFAYGSVTEDPRNAQQLALATKLAELVNNARPLAILTTQPA